MCDQAALAAGVITRHDWEHFSPCQEPLNSHSARNLGTMDGCPGSLAHSHFECFHRWKLPRPTASASRDTLLSSASLRRASGLGILTL